MAMQTSIWCMHILLPSAETPESKAMKPWHHVSGPCSRQIEGENMWGSWTGTLQGHLLFKNGEKWWTSNILYHDHGWRIVYWCILCAYLHPVYIWRFLHPSICGSKTTSFHVMSCLHPQDASWTSIRLKVVDVGHRKICLALAANVVHLKYRHFIGIKIIHHPL